MIRRLLRLLFILPALMSLWAYANSIGLTQYVNDASNIHLPSGFKIPGIKQTVGSIDTGISASDTGAEWLTAAQLKEALADAKSATVKGRASMTGYARAQFGAAWTDDNNDQWGHNGCDTRDDILKRDLTSVKYKSGTKNCVVASGVFHDPYTGTTIDFTRGPNSAVIQIDHVVPLGDAWVTGAQSWTAAKRQDYANDPLVLLTSQGQANEEKGDSDAASWLPPNKSFRCSYVGRQALVKKKYGLWMTAAEQKTIVSILSGCVTF